MIRGAICVFCGYVTAEAALALADLAKWFLDTGEKLENRYK